MNRTKQIKTITFECLLVLLLSAPISISHIHNYHLLQVLPTPDVSKDQRDNWPGAFGCSNASLDAEGLKCESSQRWVWVNREPFYGKMVRKTEKDTQKNTKKNRKMGHIFCCGGAIILSQTHLGPVSIMPRFTRPWRKGSSILARSSCTSFPP